MPCADRLRSDPGAGPNAHPRPAAPGARRLCPAAGFAAAQGQPRRRQHRRCRQRRQAPRQGQAGAVADRPDSDLRPSRRQRRVRLRLRLAQSHAQETETLSGSGQAEAAAGSRQPGAGDDWTGRTDECGCRFRRPRPPTRRRSRRRWPARWSASRRASGCKVDDDPFGAVGDYAGSFLIKSAVELSGGYDTNPGRTSVARGSPLYVVAPEFLAVSDWERHALVADLRGSFTGYGNTLSAADRRHHLVGADQSRPAGFHRSYRRPPRRQPRHPPDRAAAAARRHRQSRQPEHPGRPRQISDLFDARRHLRHRPEFQPPATFRRRHRRPHRLYRVQAHRRHLDHQRRPQLQPVRRRRPRQLRSVAGRKTVRRDRGRQPRARRHVRSQRLSAQFLRRLRQGRHLLRILAAADRRNLGRLRHARLCRFRASTGCRACSRRPR